MGSITISTENRETYSAISNFFIDYYMTEANGEFVKVYLYLVRLLNSGRAFTIADIADHFNLTEKDICRAIRYWAKEDVLRLDFADNNVLLGITMLPLTKQENQANNTSYTQLVQTDNSNINNDEDLSNTNVSVQNATSNENNINRFTLVPTDPKAPAKKQYDAKFIDTKRNDEVFDSILYITQTALRQNITQSNLDILLYIYSDLHFSQELIEYLFDYCIERNITNLRYIEKVAITWYEQNIRTPDEAKKYITNKNPKYTNVFKQLGIYRSITSTDKNYIDSWYNKYAFDQDIVMEACKQAILSSHSSSPSIKYVNKILENWYNNNVHTLSDIIKLDEEHENKKKEKSITQRVSKTNQFNDFHDSTTAEEIAELEQLFLQEVSR